MTIGNWEEPGKEEKDKDDTGSHPCLGNGLWEVREKQEAQ